MFNFSMKIICTFIAFPVILFGKIVETDSIMSILDYVQEDTLVIADLDNTLIESENQLGSSQWGDYLGSHFNTAGRSHEEIDLLVAESWCKVQPLVTVRCVDPQTPTMVNTLHKQGKLFLGLTARRPCEAHYTHQQLASVKIALSKIIEDGFLWTTNPTKGITYDKGIVFCTPINKKSHGLRLFLEKSKLFPKRIVFIDDKLTHVKDIGQLVEDLGIDYIGIRFTGADKRAASFCPKIAKIQFDYLPQIISDEEALSILKAHPEMIQFNTL